MRHSALLLSSALLALAFAAATGGSACAAEPKTEAAVLAADDDWLAAERRGDVGALDRRLADDYREITPEGKVIPKAALIDATARRKDKSTEPPAQVAAAFRAQHPMREAVVILGDTAILSFHSIDPRDTAMVRSIDVFTYDNGRWRGLLSHQSSMPAAPASPG